MTSNRLIGVGAFVLGAIVLFGLGLFMIGDRQMLFARKFEVYTEFSKLAGLESGSPVWVAGMKAGEIASIEIPPGPSRLRLKLKIRRDLQPLVRTDSVATIQTEGLVGDTFLQVSTGSKDAPEAPPGSTIPSKEPVTFGDVMQQMGDTVRTVGDTVRSVRGDLQNTMKSMSGAADRAGSAVSDIGKAAGNLADDTEALKHNFLFRGFFKDRGYFDLTAISPVDYRRGTLLTKGRAVVRKWVSADSLFRRGAKGAESLSPSGKAALDSAVGEWMQFRGEGPLMVEGYSAAATAHQQYLTSQARADLVRTYLIERFGLDPKNTGAIALGSAAQGSPQGDVFDGVALALYLDKKALDQSTQRPKATSGR